MAERRFSLTATGVQRILLGALGVLALAFVLAMFWDRAVGVGKELLGVASKRDLLTFLAVGMGGLLVALQALMSHKRAKAMEDTANAQVRANENVEIGQRQQRLRDAIEHLGHQSDSVRLGGSFQLLHIAQDTLELRETVLEILCAHIRRTTRAKDYQRLYKWHPSEEVQSLLTLLFIKHYGMFRGISAALQGSYLNGVELDGCRLQDADLSRVRMRGASLGRARLQGSMLVQAHLQGAYIVRASLDDAFLYGAKLSGTNLGVTSMRGCDLCDAELHAANLARVQMQGALLLNTQMQGANLDRTNMKGANARQLVESPEPRIVRFAGAKSDLSGAIFGGGLTEESLDAILTRLPKDQRTDVRKTLTPHVRKRIRNRPPKTVIVGSYSDGDATEWMAIDDDRVPAEEDLRIWSEDS